MKTYGLGEKQDIVVVGAGPASLGVLHAAQQAGLKALAIDKGPVCSALCSHPTYMRWFSTADKLELGGFPLVITEKNPTRQEYLKYCRAFATYFDLKIVTYREVVDIRKDGGFVVTAKDQFDRTYAWETENVVFATGFYDSPRPVGIPGEDLPKVSHRYTEAHWYADHDVLIIGAGSSAAEVALELWRNGAGVTVAMRGDRFQTKYWIEPDIENRIAEGSIACYRNTEVVEIRFDDVALRNLQTNQESVIDNDFVLAMTGYEPDTSLVEGIGAAIDRTCGKPVLNEHFESTVPGVYVAGTLCAGQDANVVFVENSREHGPAIVRHILNTRAAKA